MGKRNTVTRAKEGKPQLKYEGEKMRNIISCGIMEVIMKRSEKYKIGHKERWSLANIRRLYEV